MNDFQKFSNQALAEKQSDAIKNMSTEEIQKRLKELED